MRRAKRRNLWGTFVLSIFFAMLLMVMLTTGGMYLIVQPHFRGAAPLPIAMLIGLLLISVILGTVLSIIVGRRVLRPIVTLSKATKQVASGDFTVRIEEESNIKEIADLYDNFGTMVRELNGTETLRSDFVDNVSHEFRTPLASIEGYASLLSDPSLDASEQREFSSLIIQSVRQLNELASNILKISKLENQQIIVDKKRFSLDEQIRQTLLALEPLWSAKGINLELDLEEAEWEGGEELMSQVWQNLLSNAIKFSPQGGSVHVKLIASPTRVLAMVEDKGIGMTDEQQRHIFEKFYQADRTRNSEGNGLGLTLVKRILDLSGGTVSVQSALGKGSIFTVSLPKS